jgi:hypothetical protein
MLTPTVNEIARLSPHRVPSSAVVIQMASGGSVLEHPVHSQRDLVALSLRLKP